MKIAVDLDDILAEFFPHFLSFHNERYGTNYTVLSVKTITTGFIDFLPLELPEVIRRIVEFYHSDHLPMLPLIQGAKEGMKVLSHDNEVIIVTGRPLSIKSETGKWLDTHFQSHYNDIYFADKDVGKHKSKGELLEKLGVDYFIEDMLRYVNECEPYSFRVLMYNYPWNQVPTLPKNTKRINSWHEAVNIITDSKVKADKRTTSLSNPRKGSYV
ncbi:MAG TPA: hypothetical protein PK263_00150 [bacterium]|nr:hypothetical protein [bacterium]